MIESKETHDKLAESIHDVHMDLSVQEESTPVNKFNKDMDS
jgi:hypothetical protein